MNERQRKKWARDAARAALILVWLGMFSAMVATCQHA